VRERLSLSEATLRVAERLRGQEQVTFVSLFPEGSTRQEIVITFLAILEMVKRRLVRVFQEEPLKDIILMPNGDALERLHPTEVNDSDYR
jgi:segregation and condensation protein A